MDVLGPMDGTVETVGLCETVGAAESEGFRVGSSEGDFVGAREVVAVTVGSKDPIKVLGE